MYANLLAIVQSLTTMKAIQAIQEVVDELHFADLLDDTEYWAIKQVIVNKATTIIW